MLRDRRALLLSIAWLLVAIVYALAGSIAVPTISIIAAQIWLAADWISGRK